MNLKKYSRLILPVLLLVLTGEIVFRRLVIGQVPTQFSAFFVYALLVLNLMWVGREFRSFERYKIPG